MSGWQIVGVIFALLIAAWVVYIVGSDRWNGYLAGAQAVRDAEDDAEDDTWTDEDEAFEEARRVLDVQRQYTCAFCGRNAGHNQGCPSVRRHSAVRNEGEQ